MKRFTTCLLVLALAGCAERRAEPDHHEPDASLLPDASSDAGVTVDAGQHSLSGVGGPCLSDADCAPVAGIARCLTDDAANAFGLPAAGGYCTSVTCQSSAPASSCGLGTVCADIDLSGSPRCAAACGSARDCRAGLACSGGACVLEAARSPDGGFPALWGHVEPLAELNTAAFEGWPHLTPSLLRICFGSDRDGSGKDHLYCAERDSTAAAFHAPIEQTALNTSGGEQCSFLWRDQLYYSVFPAEGGSFDLWRAKWNPATRRYETPEPVAELNTGAVESCPSLTPDGLTLYYQGYTNPGDAVTIWAAHRSSVTGLFGSAAIVPNVNAVSTWLPSVAPDLSFLLLTSARPSSRTNSNGWMAPAQSGGWGTPVPVPVYLPVGDYLLDVRALSDGSLIAAVNHGTHAGEDLVRLTPLAQVPPPTTAWGAPRQLTELNTDGDAYQGTMTADRLKICFTSHRAQRGTGIWCASRTSPNGPFGSPIHQAALETDAQDEAPGISPDGMELFFTTTRVGGHAQVWRATWDMTAGQFGAPSAVSFLNSFSSDTWGSGLTLDGRTIVFSPIVNGHMSLHIATRAAPGGEFNDALPLSDISGEGAIGNFTPDGTTLLFSSRRALPGQTEDSTWRAWAAGWKGDGHWLAPVPVTIDGAVVDGATAPHVLSDGSLLFHNAPGASPLGLYVAPPLH